MRTYRLKGVVDEGVDALGRAGLCKSEHAVHAVHIQEHAVRLQVGRPRKGLQETQQRRRPRPSALTLRLKHVLGCCFQRALQLMLPAVSELPEHMTQLG